MPAGIWPQGGLRRDERKGITFEQGFRYGLSPGPVRVVFLDDPLVGSAVLVATCALGVHLVSEVLRVSEVLFASPLSPSDHNLD